MPGDTLTCDQAIFTSIRTPMGEGYRIVAASRGLSPSERQAITRMSPSHGALCVPPLGEGGKQAEPSAVSFYPLSGRRLCVAHSCWAGAEHTGRGGQRVYTRIVAFDRDDFPICHFNPFAVLRAMHAEGLTTPQLRPPDTLPLLELTIRDTWTAGTIAHRLLPGQQQWPCRVLNALMDKKHLIVNARFEWVKVAEALLMGLPGPMRSDISFGAGLRYSVGRDHTLQLLSDDGAKAKSRGAGTGTLYIDSDAPDSASDQPTAWTSFVLRHWNRGDLGGLSGRTSLPFPYVDPIARERIGNLYNRIDEFPQADTGYVLQRTAEHLDQSREGVEGSLVATLVATGRTTLLDRFRDATWSQVKPHWPTITAMWRHGHEHARFAEPLVAQILRSVCPKDPYAAAIAALDVACDHAAAIDEVAHESLLAHVLTRLSRRIESLTPAEVTDFRQFETQSQELQRLVERWLAIRPDCSIVKLISDQRERLMAGVERMCGTLA